MTAPDATADALAAFLAAHPARRSYMRYEDWFDPTAPGTEPDDADADGRMADWESARVYGA